jgi:hypothetical protein
MMPYFPLKGILQPLGCSLVLENAYPREWWDGILQNLTDRSLNDAWISGVLPFRDEKAELGLDLVLGGSSQQDRLVMKIFSSLSRALVSC